LLGKNSVICYNKHLLTQKEPAMSKMNELDQDIQYLLAEGKNPVQVALALEIPVSWVYESSQVHSDEDSAVEDCGPFATINS
jgi:hypothetical protein